MKKTLLIAAAALAAGVISSQAQAVYSQNIVGYVNTPIKGGYTSIGNTFDNANGNALTNILVPGPAPLWDGTVVSTWSGTSYTTVTIDSTVAGGVADASDSFAVPCPILNPGQGFFINNVGSSNTLTVVGTVHIDGAGASTNVVGVTTNVLSSSPSLKFYSSKLPIGGGLGSVLGLSGNSLNGIVVSVPVINAGGNITGFNAYTVDNTFPTGFGDASDSFSVPEPIIPVGGAFFLNNVNGTPLNWVQSF